MKAWSSIVLALLVGGAAAWITYAVMSSPRRSATPSPAAQTQPTAGPLVVTSHPAERTFEQTVQWFGTVQSRDSVQLKALVDGRIEAIQADDQAPVQLSQSIMQLGGPQVESRRAQLQASIASLKSQLALAGQTVERLSQDVKEQLATKDQLAAAQQTQLKLSGQLQDAQLALKSFDEQLVIAAPAAGLFTNRQVSVGQAVSAGQVLGDVIDPNRLRVAASLFPPPGAALQGKEATVRVAQDELVAGTVSQVLPEMSQTGATQVWIEGPQVDSQLKPGQTVSGTITIQTASALAVPASAVVYDSQERPYVFVKENESYFRRSVTLGLVQDGWVEVLAGIKQSDLVVTQGAYELYYRQFSRQFKVED